MAPSRGRRHRALRAPDAQRDYRGNQSAYWEHITFQNAIPMMSALKRAGAEIIGGAFHVDSTDDVAAAYMASNGIVADYRPVR